MEWIVQNDKDVSHKDKAVREQLEHLKNGVDRIIRQDAKSMGIDTQKDSTKLQQLLKDVKDCSSLEQMAELLEKEFLGNPEFNKLFGPSLKRYLKEAVNNLKDIRKRLDDLKTALVITKQAQAGQEELKSLLAAMAPGRAARVGRLAEKELQKMQKKGINVDGIVGPDKDNNQIASFVTAVTEGDRGRDDHQKDPNQQHNEEYAGLEAHEAIIKNHNLKQAPVA
jgi:hypothetical protein